jgi:Polyketide cyclase / dehydrase and lipid transport
MYDNALPPNAAKNPLNESQINGPMPYSKWWPLVGGALSGVLLRVLFMLGENFEVMGASFIFLAPILVGVVTVYLAERQQRRSIAYYFAVPCFANMLFVLGTLIIMIEGMICAILIVPLFSILGGIGGLVMGAICRYTNWPKASVYSIALLPLLLTQFEHKLPLPIKLNSVERSIYIDASAEDVWDAVMSARDIKAEQIQHAWMYRIGVPTPESGVVKQTEKGMVREIKMGKNIHFEQVMTEWKPNHYAKMHYYFAEDSVPAGALDDHVKIGGKYFDLKGTSYRLTPTGKGTTLSISVDYRVSTQFNWYAEPIAKHLTANFEEVILDFYKQRSESLSSKQNEG